ncbi:DUF805 domain-containing protein [bacterium]|nr:DUF805 domain-containing protein [bacterium]
MQAGFGRPANMMSFLDSIITVFTNYAKFDGRASRSEYWWFYLAYMVAIYPIALIDVVIFGLESEILCFSPLYYLFTFIPWIAVSIRRMHDLGKSGWYNLIPIYSLILLASEGESMPNSYGPVPTNTRNGNPATSYVVVQQPMQQQIVQPTAQGNNDNFWAANDGSEAYITPHNEVTPTQVTSQYNNLNVNTIPQTSGQYVVVSSPNNGGGKTGAMIIAGIVIGVALLVVLSGVLYVWASNLAENQPSELVGDWTNPEDKLELKSNGKMKDSTGTLETWYTMDGRLYFEDEDYYYSDYKYSIVDDILYLAPYNEDDVLLEDDCFAYIKGLRGESESYWNERIEQAESNGDIPNWCN